MPGDVLDRIPASGRKLKLGVGEAMMEVLG